MDIILIAAVAENGVIGQDGDLPWDIPEDRQWFKQHTIGHPVIMGRVTYESILDRLGEPLPNRTNIVLTSEISNVEEHSPGVGGLNSVGDSSRVVAATSVDMALSYGLVGGSGQVFIAGGASIYEQFLPVADRMLLTEVHSSPDGDAYFPKWDGENWEEVSREDGDGYSFVELKLI